MAYYVDNRYCNIHNAAILETDDEAIDGDHGKIRRIRRVIWQGDEYDDQLAKNLFDIFPKSQAFFDSFNKAKGYLIEKCEYALSEERKQFLYTIEEAEAGISEVDEKIENLFLKAKNIKEK